MKITITGKVATIATTIKPDEYEKVRRIKPELLTLVNEKGEPVFRFAVAKDGNGSIGKWGAEFVEGIGGSLVIQTTFPSGTTIAEAKDAIYDLVAVAKAHIEQIELTVASNIEDVKAEEKAFLDSIEVTGETTAEEPTATEYDY